MPIPIHRGMEWFMPDKRLPFDGTRVLADLNTLRGIGAYKTGVHKPTFSQAHMRSLEWLVQRLSEAGLTGAIDGIGNVIGISAKSGPKLLAGSHLESQNYAGWLDGPLGVVYALEAARVINPSSSTNGAVEVAAWCDEEGHFGSYLGSRSFIGDVTEAEIDKARDRTHGKMMREALKEAGYAGRPRLNFEPGRYAGYFSAVWASLWWLRSCWPQPRSRRTRAACGVSSRTPQAACCPGRQWSS